MAAAGTNKTLAKRELSHGDYVASLFGCVGKTVRQRSIRSYGHQLYTIEQNKAALGSIDTKRFMLPDRVHTRPLGHFRNGL